MTNFVKAIRMVEKVIAKERAWKDKHGYRENLGYDKWPKLSDKISLLNLHYTELCKVKEVFYKMCDEI